MQCRPLYTTKLEKQADDVKSPQQYSQDFPDARVLVVDDNATNRKILRHQILAWKMQPDCAASGAAALEFLRGAQLLTVLTKAHGMKIDGVAATCA
jgi:CheY-like chemotaxis protein